jgi:hypothetical protein
MAKSTPWAGRKGKRREAARRKQSATGHTATQSWQPVHSTERTRETLCTGKRAGQTLVQSWQLVQVSGLRVILKGAKSPKSPTRAP